MKKFYFIVAALLVLFTTKAQTVYIDDDMESYTVGSQIYQAHDDANLMTNHWEDWGCGGSCAIFSSDAYAHSGAKSGYIIPNNDPDYVDGVLNLGNQIFGSWGLSFWMYVPAGKTAYFNFQGITPVTSGEWAIGNIFFNKDGAAPGTGFIDWSTSDTSDDAVFSYPEDQWFQIVCNFDINSGITAATFSMYVDGVEAVAPGTPFADGGGNDPTGLGGIDFYSIDAMNEYYVDDIFFQDQYITGVEDLTNKGFRFYPNPVQNNLTLQANENIDSVTITNVLGQTVYKAQDLSTLTNIDTSGLDSGMYFVNVKIGDSEGTVKIMK